MLTPLLLYPHPSSKLTSYNASCAICDCDCDYGIVEGEEGCWRLYDGGRRASNAIKKYLYRWRLRNPNETCHRWILCWHWRDLWVIRKRFLSPLSVCVSVCCVYFDIKFHVFHLICKLLYYVLQYYKRIYMYSLFDFRILFLDFNMKRQKWLQRVNRRLEKVFVSVDWNWIESNRSSSNNTNNRNHK